MVDFYNKLVRKYTCSVLSGPCKEWVWIRLVHFLNDRGFAEGSIIFISSQFRNSKKDQGRKVGKPTLPPDLVPGSQMSGQRSGKISTIAFKRYLHLRTTENRTTDFYLTLVGYQLMICTFQKSSPT